MARKVTKIGFTRGGVKRSKRGLPGMRVGSRRGGRGY